METQEPKPPVLTGPDNPPTYWQMLWTQSMNKWVVIVPILIGILAGISIHTMPEYKAESLVAIAFCVIISATNAIATYSIWQTIKRSYKKK
jgi:hypothetical protein